MSIADISPQAMSALKEQREQLWGSIDAILAENERLRSELAESSVAVEVPELDPGANPNQRNIDNPGSFGWVVHHEYRKGYECARKIANDAISSRILKDGKVAVPEKQWTVAQMLANAWSRNPLKCDERDALVAEWNALRSGEVEGRKEL